MITTYSEKYDILTTKYEISARLYFGILRLAILYVDGENLNSSYEICQYNKSKEVYKCAIKLLKTLDEFGKGS